MIATAEKLRKLSTNDVKRYRMPSPVSRPLTLAVSVLTSYSPGACCSVGPASVTPVEPS
jgi:hypothetical protein